MASTSCRCWLALSLYLGLTSCGSGGGGGGGDGPKDVDVQADVDVQVIVGDVEVDVGPPGFDDHTVAGFETIEDLLAWAHNEQTPAQAKFVITDFSTPDSGRVHWLDASFYILHDEWFWFTLLNGQPIPGLDIEPVDAGPFATTAEVYAAFPPESDLPLELKYYGERLYSPDFYNLGLYVDPRFFGLGSVLHYPANPERVAPDELWLIELEFTDKYVDADVLDIFFQRLGATLPPEVDAQLKWLVRSVEQEALAEELRAGGGPYADRILTYADLVVAGEVVGYNEGITAGRIARFPKGTLGAALMEPDQIVVLEVVPDDVPPVSGIVTAVPQTPLAHLNLLAQSRGTPNVYVAGVMELDWLEDFEKWGTRAILKVNADGVQWKGISKEDYATWKALKGSGIMEVPMADLEGAPLTLDLTQGSLSEVPGQIPLCGGKAAAMMAFQDFPNLPIPDSPLAITVRAYAEHMAPMMSLIEEIMDDPLFMQELEVRFLILEGEEDFLEEHAGIPEAAPWAAEYIADNVGTLIGSVIAIGGLKAVIRDQPIDPETLAALEAALEEQFGHLGPTQGLRFRSSSTAEDVEGFNGAGLYDSNTGYLHPELQTTEKLQKRSVEWALKKTWASYWTFGAFEERRHAGINHLDGRMGVLVHPRFDDPMELANGVITLSLAQLPTGTVREMVVNVQAGAISVTNPDPDNPTTPEIDRVSSEDDGTPVVEHVQGSSEVPVGQQVMSEEDLLWLFDELNPLAEAWIAQANASLTEPKGRLSLILDMEFKRMAQGWPDKVSGEPEPERLVLKQVRTLDHALSVSDELAALPAPRDILEVVGRVQRRTCTGGPFTLVTTDIYTDPTSTKILPYDLRPFTASLSIQVADDISALGIDAGTSMYLVHTQTTTLEHPTMSGPETWDLHMVLTPDVAQAAKFTEFTVDATGTWTLTEGDTTAQGDGLVCEVEDLLVGPSLFLEHLLNL